MWPWMLPSSIQKVWFISPVTAGAVPVKASTSSGLFQWVPASAGSTFTLLPWGDGGWAPWPVCQHPSCLPASHLSASFSAVQQHLPCWPASPLSASIPPVHQLLRCPTASPLSTGISPVRQHPICPPASPSLPPATQLSDLEMGCSDSLPIYFPSERAL